MLVTSIFSFSHNVFFPSLYKFQVSINFILSSVNAFNLGRSRILSFGEELNIIQSINLSISQSVNHHAKCALNPFPNKPWFLRVFPVSLLKTLREKEKLLVTSNFSFSHSVFYPFREVSAIFIKFIIVVCKLFEFGRV